MSAHHGLTPFQVGIVIFDLIAFAATIAFIIYAISSYQETSRKLRFELDRLALQRSYNDALFIHIVTKPKRGDRP